AFAKTSIGELPPPNATTAIGEPALIPIPPQLAFLKKLPKGTLVALIVGVPILVLFLVVTLILANRSDAKQNDPTDNEPGIASTVAKPKRASPDKIKAAAEQGTNALEALAKEFPEDAAIPKQ